MKFLCIVFALIVVLCPSAVIGHEVDAQISSCVALTAPYHADFEGIPLGPGNLNLAGGWNNCWTFRSNSANPPRWESENSTGANENSLNTGPFFDGTYPTTAGGTYMFLESGYGDPNTSAELVSPAIDISPLATAELRFKYHMYGSNINKLVIIAEETSSGLQTRLDSLMGQQQTAGSDSFLLRTTSLQSLSGNTYRFIFQAFKGTSFRGDISIDEVRIEASCLGISADTSVVCIGDSIRLTAHKGSASGSLLWSTGDTARTIWVSPQQTSKFFCTLTSGNTQCSDTLSLTVLRGTGIDSVAIHDANKGLLIAYFDASDQFAHKLEYKLDGSNTWRIKNLSQGAIRSGSQRFNITPWFNSLLEVRMSSLINGVWEEGCGQIVQSPCKGMTVAIVQQKAPFCPEDSALLRAGISGGLGNKSYLWSNGTTTKRTYAQQTQSLWVTVTDAAGCAVTDTFTVPSLGNGIAPSNLQVNTAAGVIQAQWTPSVFSSGQSLIGYRLAYRLRNTQLWSKTPLISDTIYTSNWSGSGNPSGNYEFAVFARFLSNGTPQNSGYSCKVVKGYTASTSKTSSGNGTSAAADGHSGIRIYPNPTNDLLRLYSPTASEWMLCDLQGNVLWKDPSLKKEALIELSVYAAGVYIVHVKNSSGTYSERVIKN